MPSSRLAIILFALVALALPERAHAVTNFGTMSMTLKKKNGTAYANMNQMEALEFFNTANCLCQSPFAVEMTLVGAPGGGLGQTPVEIWVGQDCGNVTNIDTRNANCSQVKDKNGQVLSIPIQQFNNASEHVYVEIGANQIMFPVGQATCTGKTGANTVWALVNEDSSGPYEHIWSLAPPINFDTTGPDPVTSPSASGVENGVLVSWTNSQNDVGTRRGFQILCARQDGTPLLNHPSAGPEYISSLSIQGCTPFTPALPDAGVTADAGATPDAAPANPQSWDELDPSYICTGLVGNTGTNARVDLSDPTNVKALNPGELILTKIVAIDTARNATAVDVPGSSQPQPARDAWEFYHDAGGNADGGFCFVATAAYGDYDHPYVKVLRRFRDETLATFGAGRDFIAWYYAHSPPWADFLRRHPAARVTAAIALFPVVALAAVWNELGPAGLVGLVLAVVALRRRRRRLALAMTLALVAAAVPGVASAQVLLDSEEMRTEPHGLPPSDWAFEFKLGPYHPDVDGEPGLVGHPYNTVFGGGSTLMPQIELDRFFFHPAGELGIALSLGYMGDTAKAFVEDPTTHMAKVDANGQLVRSADDTSFRMLPIALLLVYRFSLIADETVIPIVPYGKLGLSYYIWRMTKGDGGLSSVSGHEAQGATPGWQASAGVAVRLEKLDPDSSRSMEEEMGVEHVSFFGEVTYADVSGLGLSNKLHVGDFTWAAGINFEF
jgi:hypothetical protein